ncbi:hypothetical protein [Amycolatopsis nigrescens]|uniref:hypothetical protein n=1 Tax=Amycolatopsis nigrescens TaxID=381445 RepID=UPI000366110A|nr:hypothetical protein [Amycolatopsis nigrescens]
MRQVLVVGAGCLVQFAVLLSVLRTLFCPRGLTSRVASHAVKAVALVSLPIARRIPWHGGQRLMDLCAPLGLCVMLFGWLTGLALGAVLMAAAFDPSLRAPGPFLLFERPGWVPLALTVVAAAMVALALTTFCVYLIGYLEALERRERLVLRLGMRSARIPDAEGMLADCLRCGSRDGLDQRFAEWAGWLSELHRSHQRFPGLLYHRPNGELPWTRAAVIVMDAAALVEAVSPAWAPPHTRVLLDSGMACLQQLASLAGVVVPATEVSLQGREEWAFGDSVRHATASGLPPEREPGEAWEAFQFSRIRYAPYAAMLGARLLLQPDAGPGR